jgi:large subunit ribosomal protein L1
MWWKDKHMGRMTKRARATAPLVDTNKVHAVEEAVSVLKGCPPVKFDQSIDVALKLGVDPKKSDQNVRGTVSLPSGTGKKLIVLALARGDKLKEAQAAGADLTGNDDLVEKIAGGWTDFDAVIATPDMMREVGKLGKVLGPRGLMPTPKAGTVTTDIAKAVREIKQGKIEFKSDKFGVVNCAIGKLSFTVTQLVDNFRALLAAVQRAKPATVKGHFLQSGYLSSTMGPGVKLEIHEFETTA